MAITLNAVTVRHERRITLSFSTALAAGAFSSVSYYTVTNTDGFGASPAVLAAIAITGNTTLADLVLDTDLAAGGAYTIAAIGVPAQDASTTPGGSILAFSLAVPPDDANVEQNFSDLGALIYGTDLVWSGADFLEQANGDLATVTGVANYEEAITRRLSQSYILPWAPNYGSRASDYVNGPRGMATALKGSLLRQAFADDRTGDCQIVLSFDDTNDPTSAVFQITIQPKAATDSDKVTLSIPVQG